MFYFCTRLGAGAEELVLHTSDTTATNRYLCAHNIK